MTDRQTINQMHDEADASGAAMMVGAVMVIAVIVVGMVFFFSIGHHQPETLVLDGPGFTQKAVAATR